MLRMASVNTTRSSYLHIVSRYVHSRSGSFLKPACELQFYCHQAVCTSRACWVLYRKYFHLRCTMLTISRQLFLLCRCHRTREISTKWNERVRGMKDWREGISSSLSGECLIQDKNSSIHSLFILPCENNDMVQYEFVWANNLFYLSAQGFQLMTSIIWSTCPDR